MVYQGSGGPPPSRNKNTGGGAGGNQFNPGRKPYNYGLYEKVGDKLKRVFPLSIDAGSKGVPVVILDECKPDSGSDPSIRIHDGFKFNGKYGNSVVCIGHRPEGCIMDKALQREHKCFPNCANPCPRAGTQEPAKGSWRWVFTAIKLVPFTYQNGPLKGQTMPVQRVIGLVPDGQFEEFEAFREEFKNLRGKVFKVSRSEDKFSAKIGTSWIPTGQMTDAEMLTKFASAAAFYGLSPEEFCKPLDYGTVLREFSSEEMAVAAKWVAGEKGLRLEGAAPAAAPAAVQGDAAEATVGEDGEGDSDGDNIPF